MGLLRDHIKYFIKSNKRNAPGRAGDFGGCKQVGGEKDFSVKNLILHLCNNSKI